jgi:Na+/H+ antiporter NhaD/arsenite permease-like protein
MAEHGAGGSGFHGPKCWIVTAIAGVIVGLALAFLFGPGEAHGLDVLGPNAASGQPHEQPDTPPPSDPVPEPPHDHDDASPPDHLHGADPHESPEIPLWLLLPFALMLASIAIMPFVNARFWHRHFPDFAFFLGAVVTAFYLAAYDEYGLHKMHHALLEYYAFIALVGGLFVVSGGILVDLKGKGGPGLNCALLAVGAVLANIVGTTGASMLLIRPFMRINEGRLRPMHIVFFIFIISNCAGCLTPIGDPPLYLGYLKGVPFLWTAEHLIWDWVFVVSILIAMFAAFDKRIGPSPRTEEQREAARASLRIRGLIGMACLVLMIFGVFLDPLLKSLGLTALEGWPIGATFQIAVAVTAYKLAPKEILKANEFNFFPVKEVGLLFIGIFATMVPALGYLGTHGAQLGLNSPGAFYFGTGFLSAVLDNAPTYLNFLQIAFGNPDINPLAPGNVEITKETVRQFLYMPDGADRRDGVMILDAISTGAVFFGAMTYIGNGPNFMVKSIADASGLRMPSFFGYLARAMVLLLPVLVIHYVVFFNLVLG